ncbi:MAG: hydrogenase accessory protein HypB, partial [Methylocystis sp.]|nr:hydrogenase accessory protein HypB [Methylocystis sp.]
VEVSAKTGAGMQMLYDWIRAQMSAAKEQALL